MDINFIVQETPKQSLDLVSLITNCLAILAAAFLGAWYAFRLQNKRDSLAVVEKNVNSLNATQTTLHRMLKTLAVIQSKHINKFSNKKTRWCEMNAIISPDYTNLLINYDSLSFLVKSGDAQLISRIFTAENMFHESIKMMQKRSDFYYKIFKSKMYKKGYRSQQKISVSEIEKMAGADISNELKNYTDSFVERVSSALVEIEKVNHDIKNVGELMFKDFHVGSTHIISNENTHD